VIPALLSAWGRPLTGSAGCVPDIAAMMAATMTMNSKYLYFLLLSNNFIRSPWLCDIFVFGIQTGNKAYVLFPVSIE
jgi:hypothetical protein